MMFFAKNRWMPSRFPAALLVLLLQRIPLPALRHGPTLLVRAAIALRPCVAVAVVLGAADALAGATHFVQSTPAPVATTVGESVAMAFTIVAAPSMPDRFVFLDPLPPGLTTFPEMDGGTVYSATPVILGVPLEPGVYTVRVTGISSIHRRTDVLVFVVLPAEPVPLSDVTAEESEATEAVAEPVPEEISGINGLPIEP
jgi:hypothetical protein